LSVSGTPTTSTRWIAGSKTVTVADGRLTVSNGSGASNNKICFIDITSVVAAPGGIAAPTPAVQVGLVKRAANGRVTLQLSGPAGARFLIETSTDLLTWERLTEVASDGGQVTYEDANADNPPQRFYRARLSP
jgi:hypothetical protein